MKLLTSFFFLIVFSLCAQESVLYLEEQVQTPGFFGKAGVTNRVESWLTADKYRKDEPDQNQSILVRSDLGKIWRIDHSDSSYQEIPAEVFQGMAMMGVMMFGVTLDSLTGAPIIPDPLFVQTTRHRKIGEWQAYEMIPAQRGEGSMSGMVKSFIMWVSPDCGISADVYANISRKMMGPLSTEYEALFKQMENLGGYPVLVETTMMGKKAKQQLISCKVKEVSSQVFDLPNSYHLVESDLLEY